jgi:integrase
MGVNIWINRGKLYLDVYYKGQRHRERLAPLELCGDTQTDKETMRLAGIIKAKREQQIFSGEYGLLNPSGGKITLYEYWKSHAEKRGNSHMLYALKHLEKYPGGTIKLGAINEKWVLDFQDWLREKCSLAQGTASLYSSFCRTVLRQAVKDRMILRNPADGVRSIRAPDSNRIYLDAGEIQKMADTPLDNPLGEEIRRAFIFACFVGLRISDLKALTWGDIDHGQIVKHQQKTKNTVSIPIKDTAWGIINDGTIHLHTSPVFPLLAAANYKTNYYLSKWARLAKIEKKIGWHTARHSFAVLSLEGGADIYTLSKLLGHTAVKTTEIYARATDKMKREAVEGLPRIVIK